MDSVALRGRVVATSAIIQHRRSLCQIPMSVNLHVARNASTASVPHLRPACAIRAIVVPILGMNANRSARLIASMDIALRQTNAPAILATNLPKEIVQAFANLFAIQIARTVSAYNPTYAVATRAIVCR